VAQRVRSFVAEGHQVAVVVSAMGKTTDDLLQMAETLGDISCCRREVDQLLATGEQQTISLLSLALESLGIPACSLTGSQAGFRAIGSHGEGRIEKIDPRRVRRALDLGKVPVVAGFQGHNVHGDTITLGRGGSDLSAIALAVALDADGCTIFTDVEGIFTADPRHIPEAHLLQSISYEECLELSLAGANVLQPRSVEMAARADLPVRVASSFVEGRGTWVMNTDSTVRESIDIKAVALNDDTAILAVSGIPAGKNCLPHAMNLLAAGGITVEMALQNGRRSESREILFIVKEAQAAQASRLLQELGAEAGEIAVDTGVKRVTIIGTGAGNHPEVQNRTLDVLASAGIEVEMVYTTPLSVTCVVAADDARKAEALLHHHFIEVRTAKAA
jgi:aspartate kinase